MNLQADGIARPCCIFRSDWQGEDFQHGSRIDNRSPESVLHSSTWEKIRENMRMGIQNGGCRRCDEEDRAGILSMRTRYIRDYEYLRDISKTPQILALDLATSNRCNMKCRTCSSDLSHKWLTDEQLLKRGPQRPLTRIPLKLDDESLSTLRALSLTGGEPLLNEDYAKLLRRLQSGGHTKSIDFEMNTNGTILPDKDIADAIGSFRTAWIAISIDGLGRENEYIRSLSSWERTVANVRKWMQLSRIHSNMSINIHCTVSAFNILTFPSLVGWLETIAKEESATPRLSLGYAYSPHALNPGVWPTKIRELARKRLNEVSSTCISESHRRKIDAALAVPRNAGTLKEFYVLVKSLDYLRNESFYEVFPELATALETTEYDHAHALPSVPI